MTSRRWIILTFLTIAALAGVEVVLACAIDPYGVWRNPAGRKLAIYFDERRAKFLMGERYIPTNFDGLLIGSSSSDNWDTSKIPGVMIFNDSVSGGNATEERFLLRQALPRGHYKLAIISLAQSLTSRHDLKEGLGDVAPREALGSLHLFLNEAGFILRSAHVKFPRSNTAPNGQYTLPVTDRRNVVKSDYFDIDSMAISDYRDLINTLRSSGAKIVYVVPPVYEPCYQSHKSAFDSHLATVLPLLPAGPIIDFNNSEYTAFRSDASNFSDCFHLNPQAAEHISELLGQVVPQTISEAP